MYLGIDLGTSNSAIAGNRDSDLRIYKTSDGTDVLPSVIYIDKRGHKFVGTRAYEHAFRSPQNVAQGFKTLMGTKTPLELPGADTTLTPEEASAEIIKTLYGQAATEAGVTEVEGAIITIPAAFNQMQSEATIRSANAAGLDRVGLLQEPIAAAMAAMSESTNKNGQFLVYDLGGGTFDLALVQSLSGSVNVVAHEGINMLGGRNFDRTILNSIVRPWLHDQFNLPVDFQKDEKYQRLTRMVQWASERAKIELSSKDSAVIFAGDDDVRITDEDGNDIFIEINFSKEQLEELIVDKIDETIALSRKVLKDNGYSHEDIDKIVFIGGPSKMPCIRNRIPQELGIPGDLQTDPMTAVALGAAIFAESREWSGATTTRKSSRASETTSGEIQIQYNFPARTSEDRARIKVKPTGEAANGEYEIQIDSQDGWTSGKKEVSPDLAIQVPLPATGENPFRITIFNQAGAPVQDASSTISITRTHATAAGIPATHTISVKVVEGHGDAAINVLEPLVEKGMILPAKGQKTFRSAKDIHSGDTSHIDLELFQHAPGVPEPELNLCVGAFLISGDEIPHGLAIRKGDEVVVNWTMDDNGLLNATVEVPSVSQVFDAGRFYADTAGHRNFEGEDGTQLAHAVLNDAERDMNEAEEALGSSANDEFEALKGKLETQQESLEQAHDAETRRSVTEEARHIRQSISRLKHAPENKGKVLTQQLNELENDYTELLRDEADARSSERFDQIVSTARTAIQKDDKTGLKEAERAISELQKIYYRELYQQPAYLIYIFKSLTEERYLATDKEIFDQLVEQGANAVAQNNIDELRHVISKLMENRFTVGTADQSMAMLAGLMRA